VDSHGHAALAVDDHRNLTIVEQVLSEQAAKKLNILSFQAK
jgi:hypothetical protein